MLMSYRIWQGKTLFLADVAGLRLGFRRNCKKPCRVSFLLRQFKPENDFPPFWGGFQGAKVLFCDKFVSRSNIADIIYTSLIKTLNRSRTRKLSCLVSCLLVEASITKRGKCSGDRSSEQIAQRQMLIVKCPYIFLSSWLLIKLTRGVNA